MTSEEAGITLPPTCSCCSTRPLIATGYSDNIRVCPHCDVWPKIVNHEVKN